MPRRRRAQSVIGPVVLGLAVAAPVARFALAPVQGQAQTATSQFYAELFQPSLDGAPNNPPTFVRLAQQGPQDSAIAPPEPILAQVPSLPPQLPSTVPTLPPPAPEVHPAKAASRPGAVLPPPYQLPISNPPPEVYPFTAANRPGATLPIPPPEDFQGSASTPPPGTPPPNTLPLGTVPRGTLPIAASDPYQAIGIMAGSFLILPALELSGGYSTNPAHASPTGPSSFYLVAAPELHVRSQWSSSSLTADVAGSYIDYQTAFIPSFSVPFLNAKVDGSFDVSRYTTILAETRAIVSTDSPGSPNISAGLWHLPFDTTLGGTLGMAQEFGRFGVTVKGTFDRSMYSDAELTNGEYGNFDWRAFDQYGGMVRLAYEVDPGLKPFVEIAANTRIHDSPVDIYGENRNSDGSSAKFGASVNFAGSLIGELAAGYMQRDYVAPLSNVGGATLDGSLLWLATALTSVKLTATSNINESAANDTSATFSRDVNVEFDHALRTWLVAMAQVGYGHDDYVGLGRVDNRYFAAAGLTYKLSREIQLKGTVREDWLTSNASGAAYTATSFLLGLRLQR